jgi:hypothetical protein
MGINWAISISALLDTSHQRTSGAINRSIGKYIEEIVSK